MLSRTSAVSSTEARSSGRGWAARIESRRRAGSHPPDRGTVRTMSRVTAPAALRTLGTSRTVTFSRPWALSCRRAAVASERITSACPPGASVKGRTPLTRSCRSLSPRGPSRLRVPRHARDAPDGQRMRAATQLVPRWRAVRMAAVGGYSLTTPAGVIRAIRPAHSVNQRLPSGPAVIPSGPLPALIPAENSVTVPVGVMRPMRPSNSVNQRLPSGPAVIPRGSLFALIPDWNSVTVPVGVIRPIRRFEAVQLDSVNQRLPSGPAVIPAGPLFGADARRELGDRAGRGDPPDPVALGLGEPQVAVGAGGDPGRAAVRADPRRELGDGAGRGDPPDAVAVESR